MPGFPSRRPARFYAADEAYQAVKSGLANSASIGFYLDKVSERSDGVLQIDGARVAEVSLVSVAANPRARVLEVNHAPPVCTRASRSRCASPAMSRPRFGTSPRQGVAYARSIRHRRSPNVKPT
jgi:phage head maturation protease